MWCYNTFLHSPAVPSQFGAYYTLSIIQKNQKMVAKAEESRNSGHIRNENMRQKKILKNYREESEFFMTVSVMCTFKT